MADLGDCRRGADSSQADRWRASAKQFLNRSLLGTEQFVDAADVFSRNDQRVPMIVARVVPFSRRPWVQPPAKGSAFLLKPKYARLTSRIGNAAVRRLVSQRWLTKLYSGTVQYWWHIHRLSTERVARIHSTAPTQRRFTVAGDIRHDTVRNDPISLRR